MEFVKSGLFSSKTVKDFPFNGRSVVEVKTTDTVDSAFRALVEHKILSAPVWDEEAKKYLGFFDITDALTLIYSVDLLISAIPDSMLKVSTAMRLAASGSASPDCSELLVSTIFEGPDDEDRDEAGAAWHPVTMDTPMSEVIVLLATETRRVPVMDASGRVCKILSQSHITSVLNDTLKELEAKNEKLPDVFNQTPRSSGGFGIREVLTVSSETQTAKDAFRMIIENGVSAIGVLDDDGKLLASITTKDIRLFKSMEEAALQRLLAERAKRGTKEEDDDGKAASASAGTDGGEDEPLPKSSTALMDMSCGDFVSLVETTSQTRGITMAPAVVVNMDSAIRKMISKLALTKKHRVFIVDDKRVPIGIVSVSDICKLLITDPKKE